MIFDSRDLKYKEPFGAVEAGTEIRFTFPCEDIRFVHKVTLFIRGEDYNESFILPYARKENGHSLFETRLKLDQPGIYYYRFEVDSEWGVEQYKRSKKGSKAIREGTSEWQITVYAQGYSTPDKYKGGLIYHIFADRFCRGSDRKKGTFHDNWYDKPSIVSADGKYHADDFFGGDFEGIISKLDYLRSLGVTVLYMSPIFESYSNHRYDTGDYLKVDSLLGDEESFSLLCKKAEEKGISIMLDGVFNHSGSDSLYFNKHDTYDTVGAYQSKDSPYKDWYYFDTFPDGYRSWWGIRNVPTLNKENPEYRKLIFGEGGAIEKWTSLGASAWRLDVADELPTEFIVNIKNKLNEIKQDNLLIGEVWEDASTKFSYGTYRPYFLGGELDGVMNYPFRDAVLSYAGEGNAERFKEEILSIVENYPKCALDTTMNFITTHDTVRAINALSGRAEPYGREAQNQTELTCEEIARGKKLLRACSILQYTLPGIPSLFYGDEAGMMGWSDPLNRGTYPWGREDDKLLEFFKRLGGIRASYKDAFLGSIEFRNKDYLEYLRRGKEQTVRVIANCTAESKRLDKPIYDIVTERVVESLSPYEAYITTNLEE